VSLIAISIERSCTFSEQDVKNGFIEASHKSSINKLYLFTVVGFKDWFQKKLKQKPADEEFNSLSESREKKDNLSYIEPEVQYSANTNSDQPHEQEGTHQYQTQSELGMEDDKLEYIPTDINYKDRGFDDNIRDSKELLSESKESVSPLYVSNDDDYVTNLLTSLPELWTGKEMKLHVIADFRDATWIMKKILQQVESGLINADIKVKEFTHLCDMTFILRVSEGLSGFPAAITAINPTLSYLLTTIKSEAIVRRKRRIGF
jgi:hypothetical protein